MTSSLGIGNPDIGVLVSRHRTMDINHIEAVVDSIHLRLRQIILLTVIVQVVTSVHMFRVHK